MVLLFVYCNLHYFYSALFSYLFWVLYQVVIKIFDCDFRSLFQQISSFFYRKWNQKDFDKSIWIGVQTCVHCLAFRHTQLYTFISIISFSKLFWKIGPGAHRTVNTCNYHVFSENHWKIIVKELIFCKASSF